MPGTKRFYKKVDHQVSSKELNYSGDLNTGHFNNGTIQIVDNLVPTIQIIHINIPWTYKALIPTGHLDLSFIQITI